MDLSIITSSRDLDVLYKLLNSIGNSNHDLKIEVLCSICEDKRINEEIYDVFNFPIHLHLTKEYNFGKNNNELANKAKGRVLLFVNEDIILDENSLKTAWNAFQKDNVGVVGINLRYPNRKIEHAGVYFRKDGNSYHRFKNKLDYDDKRLTRNMVVPAVTGAFLMIDKHEFLQVNFDESFQRDGEDIFLCLQYQKKFNKEVLYVGEATAIIDGGFTLKENVTILPEDVEKIKIAYKDCEEKVNSIMDNYKVRIVTEPPPGWILYRKASEIKLKNVWINEDVPDADIHYYINNE